MTEALLIETHSSVFTGHPSPASDFEITRSANGRPTCVECSRSITGTTADRPHLKKLMAALGPGDVVITPAVDHLSRDTTDLMVIARDMQCAEGVLRSLAEPVLDTAGDFAELVLAMLDVAAKLERRRIAKRTARGPR